ncbi:MAG: glycoside hydrolase family 9 protein [Cyclobacteriaceae bacterium]|nr:glycoside hydrolase family 9 protein [Cyclobacteriaceae bacterium]
MSAQSINTFIRADQFGYLPEAEKIVIIAQPITGFDAPSAYSPSEILQIVDVNTGEVVFAGPSLQWNTGATHGQSGDKIWYFNFSEVQTPGRYFVLDPEKNVRSHTFYIHPDIYSHVLKEMVRAFYYQRCGVAKTVPYADEQWTDVACHIHSGQDTECFPINDRNNDLLKKDLSGGWHDAGDYNKYTTFTHTTLHEMLFAYQENPEAFTDDYNIPESGNGIPDLLDEVKFELDWLIKMQLEDGSALAKVSVTQFQASSPPSADRARRFYGPADASATRAVCSIFAHAHLVFKTLDTPAMQEFAEELLQRALKAWEWLEQNPEYTLYDNAGFQSANPGRSEYEQMAIQTGAAVFLLEATGQDKYLEWFDNHYEQFNSLQWGYWFTFQMTNQDVLLHYTKLPQATPEVKNRIVESYRLSVMQNNSEMFRAVQQQTDAYKAYLKNNDYVWGSNSVKCRAAILLYNITRYADPGEHEAALKQAALNYLHNIHGRNAMGLTYISNMRHAGAARSINEIYHNWFTDGSEFDNVLTSAKGPAPGFLAGGPNTHFRPDAQYNGPPLVPPLNQPVQKAYRDWNTSWPENSWEITEPAIYYQAAYIRLISKFASGQYLEIELEEPVPTALSKEFPVQVKIYPNPVSEWLRIDSRENTSWNDINIMDVKGRLFKVREAHYEENALHIKVDHLNPGMYILTDGQVRLKFMVQ